MNPQVKIYRDADAYATDKKEDAMYKTLNETYDRAIDHAINMVLVTAKSKESNPTILLANVIENLKALKSK
jgi:hypothetical protein